MSDCRTVFSACCKISNDCFYSGIWWHILSDARKAHNTHYSINHIIVRIKDIYRTLLLLFFSVAAASPLPCWDAPLNPAPFPPFPASAAAWCPTQQPAGAAGHFHGDHQCSHQRCAGQPTHPQLQPGGCVPGTQGPGLPGGLQHQPGAVAQAARSQIGRSLGGGRGGMSRSEGVG